MGGAQFMHTVIANGIGGINAGGVEYDVIPGRGQELVLQDGKAYQYLTRTAEHARMYLELGYLSENTWSGTKDKRKLSYVLTYEGRQEFSGSKLVADWIIEETLRKENEREERLKKRTG